MPASKAVVDASILAGVILGEKDKAGWRDALEHVVPVAPALLRYELSNVVKNVGPKDPRERTRLLEVVRDYRMEIPDQSTWWNDAIELCARTSLTFYDAAYLAVAKVMNLELWTDDREMQQVAEQYRMKVLPHPPQRFPDPPR